MQQEKETGARRLRHNEGNKERERKGGRQERRQLTTMVKAWKRCRQGSIGVVGVVPLLGRRAVANELRESHECISPAAHPQL